LKQQSEPIYNPGQTALPAIRGEITLEHVTFRYRIDGPEVLHDVSLRVPAGQVVGIVGPSGSGKSTLAKLIQRLYVPESGRVLVDGIGRHGGRRSGAHKPTALWTKAGSAPAARAGGGVTASSGNYVSAPLSNVSGTSPALVSIETSFNHDLNNDGVIGAPPASDQPLFAYQGTDADGAQLYDVTWNVQGSHPFAVRVLNPEQPSIGYPHSFLYALPVENGLAGLSLGDGLDELKSLGVEDKYNATIIEPIFPMYSWYADNPTDASIDYETFVSTILPQWVDSHFSTTGDEKNLLIGFSKSGYGSVDLLFKHPTVFDAAAAFDFPADTTSYTSLGSSTADDYGTQANFQNNYELDQSFINAHQASFTTQDRLWISQGPLYGNDVADFNNLLTSQAVMHTLSTTETNDTHSWTGGWVSTAVAGLYGLEQKLNSGAVA
jgi:energy-coupling factor transporter ATP-binding protein EcfA2